MRVEIDGGSVCVCRDRERECTQRERGKECVLK